MHFIPMVLVPSLTFLIGISIQEAGSKLLTFKYEY